MIVNVLTQVIIACRVDLITCRDLCSIIVYKLLSGHVWIELHLGFKALIDDRSEAVGWRKLVKLHILHILEMITYYE